MLTLQKGHKISISSDTTNCMLCPEIDHDVSVIRKDNLNLPVSKFEPRPAQKHPSTLTDLAISHSFSLRQFLPPPFSLKFSIPKRKVTFYFTCTLKLLANKY